MITCILGRFWNNEGKGFCSEAWVHCCPSRKWCFQLSGNSITASLPVEEYIAEAGRKWVNSMGLCKKQTEPSLADTLMVYCSLGSRLEFCSGVVIAWFSWTESWFFLWSGAGCGNSIFWAKIVDSLECPYGSEMNWKLLATLEIVAMHGGVTSVPIQLWGV